jgi:small subunit ribosomal protein S17
MEQTTQTTTQPTQAASANAAASQAGKKVLEGIVVSDKMQKTVVVLVQDYVKDTKYKKYYKKSKKFKAHDPKEQYKVGDKVAIVETIPMSKDKHFKVMYS